MATPKVFSGGRAVLSWVDTSGSTIAGMWTDCSYTVDYGLQPVFVLGSYSALETEYTHIEPVSIRLAGWRVWGNGPYSDNGKVIKLKDLLNPSYSNLTIFDRSRTSSGGQNTGNGSTLGVIAKITSVRVGGYAINITAKQLTSMTLNAVGLLITDETNTTDNEPIPRASIYAV